MRRVMQQATLSKLHVHGFHSMGVWQGGRAFVCLERYLESGGVPVPCQAASPMPAREGHLWPHPHSKCALCPS